MLYPVYEGEVGLATALEQLCEAVDEAIAAGVNLIILSDRQIDRRMAAIPALLATGAVASSSHSAGNANGRWPHH